MILPQTKPSRLLLIITLGALSFGALFYFAQNRIGDTAATSKLQPVVTAHAQEFPPSVNATTPAAVTPQSEITLSDVDLKKWETFHAIEQSNNDNDPRLDSDLKNLSENLRASLHKHYVGLAPEKRNQRGLVVYIIARDIKTIQDLDFLRSVYEEAPCLSMESCGSRGEHDPHLASIDESSLNYPQLVGLYQLEKQMQLNPKLLSDPNFRDRLLAAIQQASKFPVPAIQKKAEELLAKIQQ
jgi:hypothetical protein